MWFNKIGKTIWVTSRWFIGYCSLERFKLNDNHKNKGFLIFQRKSWCMIGMDMNSLNKEKRTVKIILGGCLPDGIKICIPRAYQIRWMIQWVYYIKIRWLR